MQKWAVQLCLASVLMLILETFLPGGSTKKYIKLVISMTILIILLQPINLILNNKIKLENVFAKGFNERNANERIKASQKLFDRQVEELFIQKTKNEIKKSISSIIKDYNCELEINLNNSENNIEIEWVSITIRNKNDKFVGELAKKEIEKNIKSVVSSNFGINVIYVKFH